MTAVSDSAQVSAQVDWQHVAGRMLHPTKLAVLHVMADGIVRSPVQLARLIGGSDTHVAYHVRQLRDKGVLELVEVRRGRRSARQRFYRLLP